MYIQTAEALGQAQLPSTYGTPCLQDAVPWESIYLSGIVVEQTLDEFNYRESNLRTRHKTWIRRRLAPRIIQSWRTSTPIRTIILVGHTDEVGNPSDNYKLGLARAKAVRDQLLKDIESQRPGLGGKIKIEVFSQGECRPLVRSDKRERRNRRVWVGATNEILSPAQPPAPPAPPPPPTRQSPPNLRDLPESVKKRIEQEDERRRLTQPIPTLPRGQSFKEWFDKIMDKFHVPKWLRNKIWDAILGGDQSLASILLEQAGIRGEWKEAILGIGRAGSQMPSR